jgi:hypothetical protein
MELLRDASEVIDALGGNPGVARLFRCVRTTVVNWRTAGRFPPNTFVAFDRALKKKQFRGDPALWGMRVAGRKPRWRQRGKTNKAREA